MTTPSINLYIDLKTDQAGSKKHLTSNWSGLPKTTLVDTVTHKKKIKIVVTLMVMSLGQKSMSRDCGNRVISRL